MVSIVIKNEDLVLSYKLNLEGLVLRLRAVQEGKGVYGLELAGLVHTVHDHYPVFILFLLLVVHIQWGTQRQVLLMIKVGNFLGPIVGRLNEHDVPPQVVSLAHIHHDDEQLIIGLIQDDQGRLFLLHHIRGWQLYQLGVFPIELDGERDFLDMRALIGLRGLRKQQLAHMQGL